MSMKSFEMGPVGDNIINKISEDAGIESVDILSDIKERSKGNIGASRVLSDLAFKGAEIYNKVAPNLGSGSEIWLKYSDDCNSNLDALIEKYGN